MTTWYPTAPPVPAGERVDDHIHTDPQCRAPWDWCRCPESQDAVCGDFRFANCVLPLGHAGLCEEAE